jgi:hypothetical protein
MLELSEDHPSYSAHKYRLLIDSEQSAYKALSIYRQDCCLALSTIGLTISTLAMVSSPLSFSFHQTPSVPT